MGLRESGCYATRVFLSFLRNSSPLRLRDSESVNDTPNSTNFVRAVGTMRRIILIFIMCDLALACFAAHELQLANRRRGADN